MLEKKQNSFDDFIAAAEYLISRRYTSRGKIAIYGHSNGGLLMGAALTQRPDLFGAVVANAGHYDMLRYHRFTAGAAWVTEYGSADDPKQFTCLRAYSPLQNVKEKTCYPPTLLLAADHDDRVVPRTRTSSQPRCRPRSRATRPCSCAWRRTRATATPRARKCSRSTPTCGRSFWPASPSRASWSAQTRCPPAGARHRSG